MFSWLTSLKKYALPVKVKFFSFFGSYKSMLSVTSVAAYFLNNKKIDPALGIDQRIVLSWILDLMIPAE